MNGPSLRRLAGPAVLTLAMVLPGAARGGFLVRSAAGADASAIQGAVDQFRLDLGNPNNGNAPGPLAGGRREINWDGGGSATTPAGTPFNAFQNIRGALFTTPGTGFVQAPPTGLDTTNPTYSSTFAAFSPLRVFTPIGSNITDVSFFIPGTNGAVPATVGGFGAVFTDVDLANTTRLQFFDINNAEIFNQAAAAVAGANLTFSFLGASATAGEQIFRVRITTGNSALGPNDGPADVVVMDDFLFAEPRAVPAPPTFGLAVIGLLGAGLFRRRRAA
jgi:hypothetical protein